MKRYFVGRKEITEKRAKQIIKENENIMASGDFARMMDIQFITVI